MKPPAVGLCTQQPEGTRLDAAIAENLKRLGFGGQAWRATMPVHIGAPTLVNPLSYRQDLHQRIV